MFFHSDVTDTPCSPQHVKTEKVTAESLVVTWQPPVDNGGADIMNYVVEKCDCENDNWVPLTNSVIDTKYRYQSFFFLNFMQCLMFFYCKYRVTKLSRNSTYRFRVAAENKFGVGTYGVSEPVMAKDPYGMFKISHSSKCNSNFDTPLHCRSPWTTIYTRRVQREQIFHASYLESAYQRWRSCCRELLA